MFISAEVNDRGEPVYGERDVPDLAVFRSLGVPFWLAGSYGSSEHVIEALAAGAAGVQVGTAFAFCDESALEPDEMLTEIRVPKMQGAGWSFQKFNRRAQDWAIVGVAAWRRNGDSGVALVNMGSTPVLATSVSSALSGGASIEDAAEQAAADAEPQADLNASVEYRTHLAKVLVKRALTEAS